MSHTKIKTFEDACRKNGVDPVSILPYSKPIDADQISINAYAKLIQIARALNEGWEADWSDHDQYKYWPWFIESPSGSGLSYYVSDYWYTGTVTASRLCYKSHELAKYAGKQFEAIYQEYISHNKK